MARKGKHQPSFKVQFQAPSQNPPSSQNRTEKHKDLRVARSYRFVINQSNTAALDPAGSSSAPAYTGPDVANKQFIFAANKTTIAFTEKREDRPCPPAAKRRKFKKYPHGDKPTINVRKPVKTYIPIDAWALIFERCHPKFLIDARLVCRDFRDILNTQTIWRGARQYTFEALTRLDYPVGLTEMQYANLLVGRGCQIKPCIRRDTRKVYWPFMLRMCETCLEKQVQQPGRDGPEARAYSEYRWQLDPEVRRTIPDELMSLLPAGIFWSGKWVEARRLRPDGEMWDRETIDYRVIASDYQKLKAEFAEEVMAKPSCFLIWTKMKWKATRDRMELAKNLSALDWDAVMKRGSKRDEKEQFFANMAGGLTPPMSLAVLSKMAAYHSVLENGNAPSLRSWDLLAEKVDKPELRAQAEQLIEWERPSDKVQSIGDDEDGELLHDILFKHRNVALSRRKLRVPEQDVIVEIAHRELDNLLDVVHDEDVLLLLLNNVRKSYEALESKPIGLNGDGTRGQYRLLLDDARMVVNDVLMLRSGVKGTARHKKIVSSLRCIGCTRHDASRLDTFEHLVIHIRNTHAKFVGQDMHFCKWAYPVQTRFRRSRDLVAWYHIPWPKTMPALPAHRKATKDMVWDPDQEQDYVEHPVKEDVNLFDQLEASNNTKIAADDFTGNFCRVLRLLGETRLDSQCTIRLALEYASRREVRHYQRHSSSMMLSPLKLQNLQLAASASSSTVEFRFECGLCLKDQKCENRVREVNATRTMESLATHWQWLHRLQDEDEVENLILLPSDFELHQTITELDTRLNAQKSRARSKSKKLASGNDDAILVRRDPRSAALFGIPSVKSCFDELFVKRQPRFKPTRTWSNEVTYLPEEELVSEQEA